jgi:hypothetical protein
MINSLQEFMLFGDNLNADIYKNKFAYRNLQLCKSHENNISKKSNIINNNANPNPNPNEIINSETNEKLFVKKVQDNRGSQNIYNVIQYDSLFWCLYIFKYGLIDYEMNISNQKFTVEKDEKFKYINLVRKNIELLKLHKIKNISNLENDLGNEKKISIKTFIALCIIENINIYIIDGNKLYCNVLDETLPVNIISKNIYKNNNNSKNNNNNNKNNNAINYSIDFDCSESKLEKIKNNHLIVKNIDDKLKSISLYKLDDLINMCDKLKIDITQLKKVNKTILHSLIAEKF